MLEVIYIPELRVHKFGHSCQLLSWLNGDKYLNGVDKI